LPSVSVFAAVIDGGVRAQRCAQVTFFVGGCGRDHFGPHGFGDLNGRRTHATCRTQNQHGFTGFQGCTVHQSVVRRGVGHDEGRTIDGRKTLRQRHAEFGWGQGVGSKPTRAGQASHRLAHFQVRHTFAHGLHQTRVL
jgi:hypothetical protein